ncbi:hypothetical protein [Streptomyces fulvorobeus]|uniref:Uncharacterized protein n=1 Tax=Streptomyces fulvorobeus TaxID=284028 RepID=A0A7J0BYF6_9ACTN|nr:hypothetical protein [Streptomyces fulvorobeus]NYE39072.1 hypothetical protein [Streptomyces fulvorobeus]GFM95269.1 hypothetical protein Sfulv_00800 [Streptomyces fulvorobeus]
MRRSKQENGEVPAEGVVPPTGIWHARAGLHASHREPAGYGLPLREPKALLSFVEPDGVSSRRPG